MTLINTGSAAISFARKLEEEGARFYEGLAEKFPANRDTFLSFARENNGFIVQFERAYYSVISDAFEGGFAFSMDPEEYAAKPEHPATANRAETLGWAIDMEDHLAKFYADAAEQSVGLLPDLPHVFKRIVQKRAARKTLLESLLAG